MSSDQKKLREILARADHPPVKLLPNGQIIPAQYALVLAHRGDYEWRGSKGVKCMRPIKQPTKWVPCYRTLEAPALQPSVSWCWSLRASS